MSVDVGNVISVADIDDFELIKMGMATRDMRVGGGDQDKGGAAETTNVVVDPRRLVENYIERCRETTVV